MGIAEPLAELAAAVRRQDPHARVISYLDDIYIVVDPQHAAAAFDRARQLFEPLGLELNRSKCTAWSAMGPLNVPEALADLRVPTFKCLGSAMHFVVAAADYAEDADRVHVSPDAVTGALAPALAALAHFTQALHKLRANGLSLQHAFCLHRVYTDGAVTHLLRSGVATGPECAQWDAAVLQFWERELGRTFAPDQRMQFFLPLKLGGCGFQSAMWRRAPALVGSWELCFHAVAAALDFPAVASFRAACPRVEATLGAAAAEMGLPAAQARFEWTKLFGEPARRRQRQLAAAVHEKMYAELLASVSAADRADTRSAGGSGASLFLLPPEDESHVMPDAHLAAALRRRLRFPSAACRVRMFYQ